MIPIIFVFKQWTDHIFHESLSSDGYIVGDNMWLVLYPIPNKLILYRVISLRYLRPARKVSVKFLPLHIGIAKDYEDRRPVLRQEVSLGIEVTTLISPKWMCSCQTGTLSDDLWEKRFVSL
jgi:hypothetical protein